MAGGSGPVCSALVAYSKILNSLNKGEYKKSIISSNRCFILTDFCLSKKPILSIAHLVCLEAI